MEGAGVLTTGNTVYTVQYSIEVSCNTTIFGHQAVL